MVSSRIRRRVVDQPNPMLYLAAGAARFGVEVLTRAARESPEAFERVLAKVPATDPVPGDEW